MAISNKKIHITPENDKKNTYGNHISPDTFLEYMLYSCRFRYVRSKTK